MSTTLKDKLLDGTEEVVSGVKEEAGRKVLLKLADKMAENFSTVLEDSISTRVQDELSKRGLAGKPRRKIDKAFDMMCQAFRSNGFVAEEPGLRLKVEDMLGADEDRRALVKSGHMKREDYVAQDGAFLWDHPLLLPRVISTMVREPMEPIQVLGALFQKVRMENPLTQIRFPAISAFIAGDLDMGTADRYPEGMLEFASTIVANIGKCGIKVRFTDEMLKWSLFDVMGMHLRAAGRALALWKENKCAQAIINAGVNVLNNRSGTPALYTTGRNASLLFNGTLSLQDLHTAMASGINDGMMPDAIGINPIGWTIFAQDPTMRNWAYAQGGVNQIWQRVKGEVAQMRQWMSGMNGSTKLDDPNQLSSTYTEIPTLFPYPLRIIVSPYFPYDPVKNTVDICLLNTSELGIMSVAEEPNTAEWKDPERDIQQVRIREMYAVNILNEGRGIRWIRGVELARSYDIDDKLQLQLTGPLPTSTDGFEL